MPEVLEVSKGSRWLLNQIGKQYSSAVESKILADAEASSKKRRLLVVTHQCVLRAFYVKAYRDGYQACMKKHNLTVEE